jgi:hypothetical protein
MQRHGGATPGLWDGWSHVWNTPVGVVGIIPPVKVGDTSSYTLKLVSCIEQSVMVERDGRPSLSCKK